MSASAIGVTVRSGDIDGAQRHLALARCELDKAIGDIDRAEDALADLAAQLRSTARQSVGRRGQPRLLADIDAAHSKAMQRVGVLRQMVTAALQSIGEQR